MTDLLCEKWPYAEKNIKTLQHSATVARAARLLAERIPSLQADESFEAGLFHDFGKFYLPPEKLYQHPRVGFEILRSSGRLRLAAVCLTHPFPLIDNVDFISAFCHQDEDEIARLRQAIASLPRPDPDDLLIPLIQLCDKLSGLDHFISLDDKFAWYARGVTPPSYAVRQQEALRALKGKFDSIIGYDIYEIITPVMKHQDLPIKK